MRMLFVHQNFPGQYAHLLRHCAADSKNDIVFLTRHTNARMAGIRKIVYRTTREAGARIHSYVRPIEQAVLHGQVVAREGNDTMFGGDRIDTLTGGQDNSPDTHYGEVGDDTQIASSGGATMAGGAGADTFVLVAGGLSTVTADGGRIRMTDRFVYSVLRPTLAGSTLILNAQVRGGYVRRENRPALRCSQIAA